MRHSSGQTPTAPVVLIGPADRTSQLKTRITTDADVVEFADTDTDKAVQAIIAERPSVVILEREFATSVLGSAFIGRVMLRWSQHLGEQNLRTDPRHVDDRRGIAVNVDHDTHVHTTRCTR